MATQKLSFSSVKELRQSLKMNQTDFWKLVNITQSGGSRFEAGMNMSYSVHCLLYLIVTKQVTDKQLKQAMKAFRGNASVSPD